MYAKGKGSTVPSDAQAREKLALYVYEYLLHVGAQKAAQTFLSEIRWEKNITLGEPPGFLHSWWCVFWDLYCAAPERRDNCEHSSEAKAFHDYGFVNSGYGVNGGPAPSPMGQMPPSSEAMSGPMPPGFFPNSSMRPSPPTHPSSQPSPHSQPPQMISNQPFMGPGPGPRYGGPGPRPRLPQMGNEFNGPPGQPMMSGPMDPSRQGPGGMGMSSMGPRMNPPRPGMGPMGPGYGPNPGMRGPPPGQGMPPMSMSGQGRPQWPPNSSGPMNYNPSSSPGNYGGPPNGPPPILPSPQDSSNSGGDNIYGMMNPGGGNLSRDFPMNSGPEGGPLPIGGGLPPGDGLDIKNSPGNGPGTPRDDGNSSITEFNLGFGPPENEQVESAAILKIKESMQEEAKRFEKDSEHPDYFMQ